MPPFLRLWSKACLAKALLSLLKYTNSTLTLKSSFTNAPWLHFESVNFKKVVDSPVPLRRNGQERLTLQTPWWYCRHCFQYWLSLEDQCAAQEPLRVPMPNKHEGHVVCWHRDNAYPHLYHPKLKELYPRYYFLTPQEALTYHNKRKEWIAARQQDADKDPYANRQTKGLRQGEIDRPSQEMVSLEAEWFPPAHKRCWKSRIPMCSFVVAACSCQSSTACTCKDARHCQKNQKRCRCLPWDLRRNWNIDLVPQELLHLVQNGPSQDSLHACDLSWSDITSQDARVCVSLCRPVGQFATKRQDKRTGPPMDTSKTQAGELQLRLLEIAEDEARGMIGSLKASEELLKSKFRLRAAEEKVLPDILRWLKHNNPWLAAYSSSAAEAVDFKDLVQKLSSEGCLYPSLPESLSTTTAKEMMGDDQLGVFQFIEDLGASTSNCHHIWAAAKKNFKAKRQCQLPVEWQDVHTCDLCDAQKKPMYELPTKLMQNKAFTDVSAHEFNVEAKVFVLQHPWSTGSFRSTLDCITNRAEFRLSRDWSLDQQFSDDADPECFFFSKCNRIKSTSFTPSAWIRPFKSSN